MIISTGIKDGWPSNELILRWREQNELGHWVRKEKSRQIFIHICTLIRNMLRLEWITKRLIPLFWLIA